MTEIKSGEGFARVVEHNSERLGKAFSVNMISGDNLIQVEMTHNSVRAYKMRDRINAAHSAAVQRAVKEAVERCAKIVENNFTAEFVSVGSIEDVPKRLSESIRAQGATHG